MSPRKLFFVLGAMLLCTVVAFGQSSGNFTYGTGGGNTACVMDQNGTITGGVQCVESSVGLTDTTTACPTVPGATCASVTGNANAVCDAGTNVCAVPLTFSCTSNSQCLGIYGSNSGSTCSQNTCTLPANNPSGCIGSAKAGIKTNSGSGNVFVIRPSAVIGLLTDATISSKQITASGSTSSSALAGIDFQVTVTPQGNQLPPGLTPTGYITYDARYVQISSNLFQAIAMNCLTITNGCFLTFAESTVSAHSFDWIAGTTANGGNSLSSGQYGVTVNWQPSAGFGVSGIGEALACVGPVNLTVQQNKMFQFNTVNSF